MSNIMSLKGIMNKPRRNGFDKSQKNAFSAKAGELLPCLCEEVLPGDKFKINLSAFTRTMPVDTAAYTRLREYYDFYFVPIRQLWRYADDFFIQMNNTTSATSVLGGSAGTFTSHPWIDTHDIEDFITQLQIGYDDLEGTSNIFGEPRSYGMNKLLEYLGYVGDFGQHATTTTGVRPDVSVNPFPLLAYQKIYSDYYRFDQWEKVNPSLFNVDYINNPNSTQITFPTNPMEYRDSFFDLRYCNWNKDLFTGLLPSPQFGDTAVASPLTGTLAGELRKGLGMDYFDIDSSLSHSTGLSIFALRQCEAMQRWSEISGSHRQNYQDQLKAHWNVSVSDERSGRSKYLGGVSSNIDINEVVNNNLASSSSHADIAGKGAGVSNGHIEFESHDYGIIMCIYHCVPLLDYTANGFSPLCLKRDATDYAIPELDSLGMQPVPLSWLLWTNSKETDELGYVNTELGYAPRYIDYKTSIDRVRGAFTGSLRNWVTPVDREALVTAMLNSMHSYNRPITWPFFKVNPRVLDSIFALSADDTYDTDQFLVNAYFDCKIVRNLDYNGLPY